MSCGGEREPKKLKMNNHIHSESSNDPPSLTNNDSSLDFEGDDGMVLDDYNNATSSAAISEFPCQSQQPVISPIHNNIDLSKLPEADCVEQFLENPLMVKPKPEFLNLLFNEDDTILTHAVKIQNVDAVAALVKAGANANATNRKGITPISAAAHKGNVAVMQILIDGGAVVNALNSSGSTALIQASHFGHIDAVSLLVKNKAVPDFANTKGTTALMRASQEGHVEISRILIQAGVDVNRKNNEGMNALMLASQRGHSEMAVLLIRARAVVDEQTTQGSTALMLACKRGHEKVVEVLVSMGAELYIRDSRGRCARDTAEKRHHEKLLKYLDTQMQIKSIQSFRTHQRAHIFSQFRKAYHVNGLRIESRVLKSISVLMDTQNRGINNVEGSLPHLESVKFSKAEENNSTIMLAKSTRGYEDYQWPLLFLKTFEMPLGVFDLIMDFLPSPRIWDWSLIQLRRRCRLAPRVAIMDSYIIMDEILSDSNIFPGSEQKGLLVRLANEPDKRQYMVEQMGMKESLVNSLCKWSDLQSLICRTGEADITFKAPLAKEVLTQAKLLHRWHLHRTSPLKYYADLYGLLGVGAVSRGVHSNEISLYSNGEMITEATDVGGEDDCSLMDHDQDTETENLAENDMEQDDPDDMESDEEVEGIGPNGIGFGIGVGNEIVNGGFDNDNNNQVLGNGFY